MRTFSFFFNRPPAVLHPDCFPKMVRVPLPWVRYNLFCTFWRQLLPQQMHNNLLPAKAMFATGIMHLHASKHWGGQGLVTKGVPIAWGRSLAPGTGKTHILAAVQALMGMGREISQGGASSGPGKFAKLILFRDLCVCFDEIMTQGEKRRESNKSLKDIVHCIYNQTSRDVLKTANSVGPVKPLSSFVCTSNLLANEKDAAFWERVLLIEFEPLEVKQVADKFTADNRWNAALDMLSCLLPDFESLRMPDSTLDKQALMDCCSFMNKINEADHSRNPNVWGMTLYYMLLLDAIAWRGASQSMHAIFEFVCTSSQKQHKSTTAKSDLVHKFIGQLNKLRKTHSSPFGAEDRTLGWHNFRTNQSPYVFGTAVYWAVELEAVCSVMHRVMIDEVPPSPRDLHDACKKPTRLVLLGHTDFYNASTQQWPIKKTVTDEASLEIQTVPLPENELEPAQLVRKPCLWLAKEFIDQVLADVKPNDFRELVIKSAKDQQDYCFYKTVMANEWFGFRAIDNTAFSAYTGFYENEIDGPRGEWPPPDLLVGLFEMHAEENLPTPIECLQDPQIMKQYFGTKTSTSRTCHRSTS